MDKFAELFGWSGQHPLNLAHILAVVLGMTVPIAIGVWLGYPQGGICAAFGGLAVSSVADEPTFARYNRSVLAALVVGALAFICGSYLSADRVLALLGLPLIIFMAALCGSLSRSMAKTTTFFSLFVIIASSFNTPSINMVGETGLFILGGLLTWLFSIAGWPLRKRMATSSSTPETKHYTAQQLVANWRKNLRSLKGWQYPVRITASAVVSALVIYALPLKHPFWILLTVVIVVQRTNEPVPHRLLQRAIGTSIGVIILGIFSGLMLPIWSAILIIGVLAGLRVYLKDRNYLLYAMVMTGLVILLLDFGNNLSFQLMFDRLIATAIGCLISLVFGYLVWRGLLKDQA